MKRIAVFNILNINNHGDRFIADCVRYLLDRTSDEQTRVTVNNLEASMSEPMHFLYRALLRFSKLFAGHSFADKIVLTAVFLRNKQAYQKILAESDAVIIGGGSLKYGTQKVWADYSLLIETAAKRHIPVMFNAVNVQKADPGIWKCRYLKDHLHYENVAMITTRDGEAGVKRLKEEYGVKTVCAAVGDPAFRIPECYGIQKHTDRKIAGINVINGRNFRTYGGTMTEDQVVSLYREILQELDRRHIPWELFTNGMAPDLRFAEKIVSGFGDRVPEVYVPETAEDLAEKIASYRVILGGRLHACICAYALDIPFTGFYWDEKLVRFAEMAKTEDLFFSESALDPIAVADKLEDLYQNGYTYDAGNRDHWKEQTGYYLKQFLEQIR